MAIKPAAGDRIKQDFAKRRKFQLTAIWVTLVLLLAPALLYHHSQLLADFSKNDLLAAQVLILCAFIGFTAANWRCPSCGSYLGPNLSRRFCGRCNTELQYSPADHSRSERDL